MKNLRLISFLLLPIALIINYISTKFPAFVTNYYTYKINKVTVEILSNISAIFPFSIYEITMYAISISIIIFIISIIYYFIKDLNKLKIFLKNSLLNISSIICVAYFLFIILWGINYNKLPLETILINNYNSANKTNITSVDESITELKKLYEYLVIKTNESRLLVLEDNNGIMKSNTDCKGMIQRASFGFDTIENLIPNLNGNYRSPKRVISSNLMSYTGITGIYFPFTGEANINTSNLDMSLPSTILHEMAHQRGYASEDEANFIAYLACINHPDSDFVYSGYRLALYHTSSVLSKLDRPSYDELKTNLSKDVISDMKYSNNYWSKYDGKISKTSDSFNNSYLKANGVQGGTENYSMMVNLLLTYYNLYGYH